MTNEKVRNRIQNANGVHDDLLLQTMVKKWKLRWYVHISRSSGMVKTILQGTVKGARRRGRQKKRWEDNIKGWTGMEFGDSLRTAEDREGWKGIVATSYVVSDAKSRQVALINFRFKQLKMASRKTMPSIMVYFKTSTFNQEAVMD